MKQISLFIPLLGTLLLSGADRHRDPSVRQQTCGDGTSGAETAGTTSVVYGCPGSENDCSGQFSCAGNTSPPAKNG